ncbi:MAG: metal-dependent transcriptional regulator [Caldilineales bacterium]
MDDHNTSEPLSESVEMYLLRIALLQEDDKPVPISALAEELAVSPVSANQMCRKLAERGVVTYEPYRGVTLTLHGEAVALRVLRKRRLWEVFLAEKLGMEPHLAEEMACRFEHVTPDVLAERLASYLGNPALSPQGEPIPASVGSAVRRPRMPLNEIPAGHCGQIVSIGGDDTTRTFLRMQGIGTGVILRTLATASDGSMLVLAPSGQVSLADELVHLIEVTRVRPPEGETAPQEYAETDEA